MRKSLLLLTNLVKKTLLWAVVLFLSFPATVFAQSATNVRFQAVVNGNVIVDKTINVPDGCTVPITGKSNAERISGPKAVCAIAASGVSYHLIHNQGWGTYLETLAGYRGNFNDCVDPNCWVYKTLRNSIIGVGVLDYTLQSGDTIIFKYGPGDGPVNAQQGPLTQPKPTTSSRSSTENRAIR